MRDVTPQVETREISDSELDGVAAGAATLGGSFAGLSANVTVDGTAVQAVEGLAGGLPLEKVGQVAGGLPTAGI